jgi:heterodisulfide reductase subunit A
VDFDQKPETITLNVGAIVVATGFELFDARTRSEYGYGRYRNVLISLEFERLLSASGPTGGHILRLSDGHIPRKIAFIQCVGSRSLKGGVTYCSSACCMYATKESILIREHEPECEVYIFYNELRVFGKGFQDFVTRAKDESGLKYIRALPGEVIEDPKTGELTIWYEDTIENLTKSINVDLVVLCPALIPRTANKELAGILGLELDEYGFFKPKDPLFSQVDTNVTGVFICGYCQGPKDIPESVAQASGAAGRVAETLALLADKEV